MRFLDRIREKKQLIVLRPIGKTDNQIREFVEAYKAANPKRRDRLVYELFSDGKAIFVGKADDPNTEKQPGDVLFPAWILGKARRLPHGEESGNQ